MAVSITFTPERELHILGELVRLGYVREGSPRQREARGYWTLVASDPQPCFLVYPCLSHLEEDDQAGYVMLMVFPDGDLTLHCGFTGRIEYLDSGITIENAVLEAERFASSLG